MSACAHRPEDGCAFVPCAVACREVGGCVCKAEVKQDEEAAQDPEPVEAT